MQTLEHNTAATVAIGLAVDWRDGKTLLTETPTLTDLACTLYKNGTASSKTLTGSLTVDAAGMLLLELTADDTDTPGQLTIVLTNAVVDGYPTDVILPRQADFAVLAAAEYAAWIAGEDPTLLLPDATLLTAEQRAGLDQLWAFGEAITYHPADGTPVLICAVVSRQGPAELMGLPAGRAERLMITALNAASGGIATETVDTGKDFVTVAARLGDTPRKRRLVRVVDQDAAMATYEVQ
jgi:hypothetical protein